MKLRALRADTAFTLAEMMVATAIGAIMLAILIASSVGLQKSFNAADRFFSTHIQQIRIIDYLSRDVKRSNIVFASTDQQTVTCTIPNLMNGSARRTPVVLVTTTGPRVDYGRIVTGALTKNSTTFTAAVSTFTAADVG